MNTTKIGCDLGMGACSDPLKNRILKMSEKLGLAHIGSCMSTLPILKEIYKNKKYEDKVCLSAAHSHLAHCLFTTREDLQEEIIKTHGIHCDRKAGCDVSGGSLGHGLGISIGLALVCNTRTIHCIISDGEMMEGSCWEALRIRQQLNLRNLKIYANFNGHSAVGKIDCEDLMEKMWEFAFNWDDIKFYCSVDKKYNSIEWHYKKL